MEKILIISRVSSLEDRLGDLLDSPRYVSRVSSWDEAHRVLTRATPAAVVVGPKMVDASEVAEIIRLNSILQKDNKKAFILTKSDASGLAEWSTMFETVAAVLPMPSTPKGWDELRRMLRPYLADLPTIEISTSDLQPPQKKVEVAIRLPDITTGKLDSISLARILYCLHLKKITGVLGLSSGKIQRRFSFNEGRFAAAPDTDSSDALTSAFAWPDGKFKFLPTQAVSGTPRSIYPLVKQGLATHRPQRQIMDGLMPLMSTFPTRTQLWDRRSDTLQWRELQRLIEACNGQQTLEKVLSSMGRDVTAAFRAAVFAGDTDLVVFRGQKTSGVIHVQYDFNSGAATSRNPGADTPLSKADRATGSQRLMLEKELKVFLKAMNSMSPYEAFGVWEGCGREVVKESFYSMVKEHHPDVYGGNISGKVKGLAQKIFIAIRKNYAELMKLEKEQTVAPPDQFDDSKDSSSTSTRRKQLTTLRFSQSDVEQASSQTASPKQVPGRQKNPTNPIRMGRRPTDTHPDLKFRMAKPATNPRTASSTARENSETSTSTSSESKKPSRTSSLSGAKKSRTASLSGAKPRRSSSVGGSKKARRTSSSGGSLGDTPSEVEWRRSQIERLERKPSRTRRPTNPISTSKNGIPSRPDPARDNFNKGYQAFKLDNFSEALPSFEKAHLAEPKNGLYMTFYAFCLSKVDPEESKKSKELLRKAIETGHRQALPDAHLFLGQLLNQDGREKQAYKHFKATLQLNPGSRAAERYVRLYERRHSSKQQNAEEPESEKKQSFFKNLFKK